MKIAFDVSYIHKRSTGIGRASFGLLSSLLRQDRQHDYVLHGWSNSLDTRAFADLRGGGVSLRIRRIPGFIKRYYWNRLRCPAIERFVGPVDLFHSADPFSPPSHCPTVVTLHDLISFEHPEWLPRAVAVRHNALLRSLDHAAAIIVPSEWTRSKLSSIQPRNAGKAEVVHWVADSLFTREGSNESDERTLRTLGVTMPYILFVGTLEPRKNLVNLVKAFRSYRSRGASDLNLVVVGKRGWKTEPLDRTLRGEGGSHEIHMTGFVGQSALAALYRKARVFIYPSLDEGFGLPILEALSCGSVVVASDIPPLKELYPDSAIFVDPLRPDAIAEGLRQANEDSGLRTALKREAVRTCNRFNGHQAANQVLDIYKKLQ